MKKLLHLLFLIFLFSKASTAQDVDDYAQNEKFYYDFHPLSTLFLGGSFDPNHIDEGKISPLKNVVFDFIDGPGSNQTNFELHMVSSRQQLSSIVQFDTKLSARYFKVKVNTRFSFLNSYNFNQNDINLVISAKSEFSRRVIKSYEFTQEAKNLMDNPKRFRKVYGNRIVTMERVGASVYCIIKISNVSTSMRRRIQADLNVQAKFGPVKVNLSSALRKEFEKANSENRIDMIVVSTADREGVSGLAGFINSLKTTGYDFDTLMNRISNYMREIKPEYAKPIGYFTTSINNLGLPKPRISDALYSERFENALREVAEEYQKAQGELVLINDLLSGQHPAYIYLEGDVPKILRDNIPLLKRTLVLLAQKQEELVIEYDGLNNDRKASRIANNESGRLNRWGNLFTIEKVNLPATEFLKKINTIIKTNTTGNGIIVQTKQIESISFSIDWLDKDTTSQKITIDKPVMCVTKNSSETPLLKFNKTSYINFTVANVDATICATVVPVNNYRVYEIWGNLGAIEFKEMTLKNYFESKDGTQVKDLIDAFSDQILLPIDNRYNINIIIKNSLGDITNVPLGILYYQKTSTRDPKAEFNVTYFPSEN